MAKEAKPWYRASKNAWFVCVGGRQILLAKGKANRGEAYRRFHALMLGGEPTADAGPDITVQSLSDAFLERSERELKPPTLKAYRHFCRSFAKLFGTLRAKDVRSFQVDSWVSAHRWGQSAHWTAKSVILSAFNWGVRQGLLTANPIKGIKKPPMRSRGAECLISPEDHARLMQAAPAPLRRVLFALHETGARPGEVLRVEAQHFDPKAGVWILPEHKTDASGKPRIIALTPALVQMCKELAEQYPTGPLFRNSRGRPFKPISVANRVLELRKRQGIKGKVIPYGYRHTLATDALSNGVPDAHVAALLGHASTAMLHRHYGHLTAKAQTLKSALANVR